MERNERILQRNILILTEIRIPAVYLNSSQFFNEAVASTIMSAAWQSRGKKKEKPLPCTSKSVILPLQLEFLADNRFFMEILLWHH
jgi:hypothetical protein